MSERKEYIQEIQKENKIIARFWKTLKRNQEAFYCFDKDFVDVDESVIEDRAVSLRADIFVKTVLGPEYEITPLTVFYALYFVCEDFSVYGWEKYMTKEYLEGLMGVAREAYLNDKL